jgi:hypothetical protein
MTFSKIFSIKAFERLVAWILHVVVRAGLVLTTSCAGRSEGNGSNPNSEAAVRADEIASHEPGYQLPRDELG